MHTNETFINACLRGDLKLNLFMKNEYLFLKKWKYLLVNNENNISYAHQLQIQ